MNHTKASEFTKGHKCCFIQDKIKTHNIRIHNDEVKQQIEMSHSIFVVDVCCSSGD